jgi:hypothetical protein
VLHVTFSFLVLFTGANLALAKSGAGQQLDLINVMSYDAGNIQSTGFNASESYMAHRAYWKTQAIALGVQVCVWRVQTQLLVFPACNSHK